MTHARTTTRNYIANTILGPLKTETAAGEIYRTRGRPTYVYPAISVMNSIEQVQVENPGYINNAPEDLIYRRFQQYMIEIAVKGNVNPDTALDDLCELVEEAMGADPHMGGDVIATDMLGTTFTTAGQGDELVLIATLTYQCEYRTTATQVQTILG